MNTAIVDALIQAVLALSPEEQTLFETKLHSQKHWQDTLNQVTAFADAVRDRRGGALYPSLSEYVQIDREERTQQQDEFLKSIFPTYNPPPADHDS